MSHITLVRPFPGGAEKELVASISVKELGASVFCGAVKAFVPAFIAVKELSWFFGAAKAPSSNRASKELTPYRA